MVADRETYEVLQHEHSELAPPLGPVRDGIRTVRVEEFVSDPQIPAGKLEIPEGIPLPSLGAPGPLLPDVPRARADEGVAWEPFSSERLVEARAEGKAVLLYFTADWCRPCQAFEEGAALRLAYRVGGIPLTFVLGADGREVWRQMGNVHPTVLLDGLRRVVPPPRGGGIRSPVSGQRAEAGLRPSYGSRDRAAP